jgi:hypothetical protein
LCRKKAASRNDFDPAVIAYNGRIVKLIGDGVIAKFSSVVDAVTCALRCSVRAFQRWIKARRSLFRRRDQRRHGDGSLALRKSPVTPLQGACKDCKCVKLNHTSLLAVFI